MALFYRRVQSTLYGYIDMWRSNQGNAHLIRRSKPFVIGHPTGTGDRLEILGSVEFMLRQIRRLISEFDDANQSWHANLKQSTDAHEIRKVQLKYAQEAMDFVVLVSTHTRNLLDLFTRFGSKSISRLDYNNSPDGVVTLRELLDTLIHHRYYYFDGDRIRDLFSSGFKKKQSALAGQFMGYAFHILDFTKAISAIIEDVTIKDLTQLLRGKFSALSLRSKPHEVVFLVQNLESLSELLNARIATGGDDFMRGLIFSDPLHDETILHEAPSKVPPDATAASPQWFYQVPAHIGIARNLTNKGFDITIRRAAVRTQDDAQYDDLEDHRITIGFESFFQMVNASFGDDHLIPKVKFTIKQRQ